LEVKGAAERALIHSQSSASEVTRCQPRRSTAQKSSEVQPEQFVEDYFHHFTNEAKHNTASADLQSITLGSRQAVRLVGKNSESRPKILDITLTQKAKLL
jgi:hypothetical protein